MNLFSEQQAKTRLPLKDADVLYFSNFISSEVAADYFEKLLKETQWQQDFIQIFGRTYPQPRLTALYGTEGRNYSYSGIEMIPHPLSHLLKEILAKVEQGTSRTYTTILLNLYRDGQDSNGWHSDDEKELGGDPVIASLSLGVHRKFQLRHKFEKKKRFDIELEHGSLLLMKGATQHNWQHQIPKSKKIHDPRINLTFRTII